MKFSTCSKKHARSAIALSVLLALGACSSDDDNDIVIVETDADTDAAPETITTTLDAEQELPVPEGVPAEATGTGEFSVDADGVVDATVTVSGLSGTATMAHIHRGFAGQTGPIIVPLETLDGGTTWTVPDDSTPLTQEQIEAFNRSELYFNVHTELNPAGEIRGQIDPGNATTFTVTINNVSTAETLIVASDGSTQPVPLSPGVFLIHRNSDDSPLLQERDAANAGLEAVAEDGNVMPEGEDGEAALFGGAVDGVVPFTTPVGADAAGPIGPGASYEFSFQAVDGDLLDFVLMFIPSNDWFYTVADEDNSFALFEGGQPVGDTTLDTVVIYDAGTEADEEPGTGPNQVQRQNGALNVGPVDPDPRVASLEVRGQSVDLASEVIEVTISAQ